MALANYSDLQSALADWLARTDLTDRIPDFITLAEATLNKVLRDTRMIGSASLSLTTSAYEVAAPTDMLEPVIMFNATDPTKVVEQISVEQLVMIRRHRLKVASHPKFFAIVGRNIEIAPVADQSYTYTFRYYQSIPDLASNSTNWVMTYNPDLYLYTALMHAAPFLNDQQRMQVLGSTVVQTIQAALNQNRSAVFDTKAPGFSLNAPSDNATTSAAMNATLGKPAT